jgi:hypothetical protein
MMKFAMRRVVFCGFGMLLGLLQLPAETPPPANTTVAAAPAAPAPVTPLSAMQMRLNPVPAPGSAPLPAGAQRLLSGYEQQAQEGLILAYFAAGTLGDALTGGTVTGVDGVHQADSYLALATSAQDDLRQVRAAYALPTADLDQLDKLAVAYGEVIPMIQAARRADAQGSRQPRCVPDGPAQGLGQFVRLVRVALTGWLAGVWC